jgi:hypothetical protein
MELIRRPIRGSGALQSMLGVGPLVVIPTLKPKGRGKPGRKKKASKRKAVAA